MPLYHVNEMKRPRACNSIDITDCILSEICKNNCQNPYNICYDNYLNTNACTECTGLICTPAKDNDEWESYRKIFDFIPEPPEDGIPLCK